MNATVAIGSIVVVAVVAVTMLLVVDRVLKAWMTERRETAQVIADLAQRIQAPDHAVIKHFNDEQPEDTVRAVNEFIDDDYWPTRDELADKAAEAEVNGSG